MQGIDIDEEREYREYSYTAVLLVGVWSGGTNLEHILPIFKLSVLQLEPEQLCSQVYFPSKPFKILISSYLKMYISALFVMMGNWKQSRCLISGKEGITLRMHVIENHAVVRNSELDTEIGR